MKRSVMRAVSFYLSSLPAGFLCVVVLTFPNVGNATTYEELWQYAIKHSSHVDWCKRTFGCLTRPKVVFTANMPEGRLGETLFKDPDTIYIRQSMDTGLTKAVIVHEFVHVLQMRRGAIYPEHCSILEAEREAWRVGMKYAGAHRIPHPPSEPALRVLADMCAIRGER